MKLSNKERVKSGIPTQDTGAKGYVVEANEVGVNLRQLSEAYPTDIFPDPRPTTVEEDDRVQRQMGRAAAKLMRHHGPFLLQAAGHVDKLTADLKAAKKKCETRREENIALKQDRARIKIMVQKFIDADTMPSQGRALNALVNYIRD